MVRSHLTNPSGPSEFVSLIPTHTLHGRKKIVTLHTMQGKNNKKKHAQKNETLSRESH